MVRYLQDIIREIVQTIDRERRKKERKKQRRTSVETAPTLLAQDPRETTHHALLGALATGNVRAALDSNVRVRDARREQLAQRTEVKTIGRGDAPALLDHALQLLEDGVLQDRVDDEHERRQHASEQSSRALITDDGEQGRDGARGSALLRLALVARQHGLVALRFASRHARVDDPDGVRHHNGRAAGDGASSHGLQRRQFPTWAVGGHGRFEEPRPGPFVPVVVDEVGHCDAEEGAVQASVETGDSLARHDALGCGQGARFGFLGLDLGAGGQRDEGVGQTHGEETAACTCEGVGHIVGLLGSGCGGGRGDGGVNLLGYLGFGLGGHCGGWWA